MTEAQNAVGAEGAPATATAAQQQQQADALAAAAAQQPVEAAAAAAAAKPLEPPEPDQYTVRLLPTIPFSWERGSWRYLYCPHMIKLCLYCAASYRCHTMLSGEWQHYHWLPLHHWPPLHQQRVCVQIACL